MHGPVDEEEQVGQLEAAGRRQGGEGAGWSQTPPAASAKPPPPSRSRHAATPQHTPALLQGGQHVIGEYVVEDEDEEAEEGEREDEEAEEGEEEEEQEAEQERREFGIYQCLPVDDAEPDWESGEAATVEEYLRRVR